MLKLLMPPFAAFPLKLFSQTMYDYGSGPKRQVGTQIKPKRTGSAAGLLPRAARRNAARSAGKIREWRNFENRVLVTGSNQQIVVMGR